MDVFLVAMGKSPKQLQHTISNTLFDKTVGKCVEWLQHMQESGCVLEKIAVQQCVFLAFVCKEKGALHFFWQELTSPQLNRNLTVIFHPLFVELWKSNTLVDVQLQSIDPRGVLNESCKGWFCRCFCMAKQTVYSTITHGVVWWKISMYIIIQKWLIQSNGVLY